eukprot:GFYU01035201.1.p1 GENE.GFYU01035201.1~~GFYU01035201.1.p1  ORF type:complete len:213 (-),score=38.95 GFYU01035201.1:303-941(-)
MANVGARCPKVYYAGDEGIMMDYIESGPTDETDLARQIATLHRHKAPMYGDEEDGYLALFPLPKGTSADWKDLWTNYRIRPLAKATAKRLGSSLLAKINEMCDKCTPPIEGACLIHGDLWCGNVVYGKDGAYLIDGSVWYGERGVDLAMMELFGGFGRTFWQQYEALFPIPSEVRATIPYYQVYYLLVHVYLFGSGYVSQTERAVLTALKTM